LASSPDHPNAVAVRELYTSIARHTDGMLDRGPYIWNRVRSHRGDTYEGFGVFAADQLRGYLFMLQTRNTTTGRAEISLSDFVFADARSAQALMRFLADFSTMCDTIKLFGHPAHPLLFLMDSVAYSLKRRDYWMLRIIDARAALHARGYSPSIRTEFALQLEDDLIDRNNQPFTVSISNAAAVTREGIHAPLIRCNIRAMAGIFAGYITPSQAAVMGLLRDANNSTIGPDSPLLRQLDGVFTSAGPAMTDMF
jgi:predicted acetyltransferase